MTRTRCYSGRLFVGEHIAKGRLFTASLVVGQDAGLQLLRGGEGVRQRCRQRIRQQQAIACHANRRVDVAKRILDDDPVVFAAKDQPDAGIVARFTVPIIQRRETKIHLAGVLGLERAHLQVNRDQAAQPPLIEEQVDIDILAANIEVMLAANERKPFSQLQQQVLYPGHEGSFDVALVRRRPQA